VAGVTIGKRVVLDPLGSRDGELDRIFFESSSVQSFDNNQLRGAFRERWLGRYLTRYPEWAYVATLPNGDFVGYLIGCLDDPALDPMFDDIGYFKTIPTFTAAYPAHLHVNLTEAWRGQGVGRRLMDAFAADASAAGSQGVHVVTGRNMHNVSYYAKVGFKEVGVFPWNGRELLFLGRKLAL
jgi:GNAT superfamily N-acetyltransferase